MENENLKSKLKDAQARIDESGVSDVKKDLEELSADTQDKIGGGVIDKVAPACDSFACSVYMV